MTQGTQGDALGLSRVRDDDELLDALGSRQVLDVDDPLVALLGSWTREIDADEKATAPAGGLFGGGWHDAPATQAGGAAVNGDATPDAAPVRVLRVNGSRAAAVAAVLVATMSGGGVAAAMTGRDVPIVSHIVAAARPLVVAVAGPAPAPVPSATGGVGSAAWQDAVDEMMRSELAARDKDGASKVLNAIPPAAYADPASAAKIAEWKRALAQLDDSVPVAGPTAAPTAGPTAPGIPASTPGSDGSPSQPAGTSRPDHDSSPTSKPTGPSNTPKSNTDPVSGSGSHPSTPRPDPTPTGPVRGNDGLPDPAVPVSPPPTASSSPEPAPERTPRPDTEPRQSDSSASERTGSGARTSSP